MKKRAHICVCKQLIVVAYVFYINVRMGALYMSACLSIRVLVLLHHLLELKRFSAGWCRFVYMYACVCDSEQMHRLMCIFMLVHAHACDCESMDTFTRASVPTVCAYVCVHETVNAWILL